MGRKARRTAYLGAAARPGRRKPLAGRGLMDCSPVRQGIPKARNRAPRPAGAAVSGSMADANRRSASTLLSGMPLGVLFFIKPYPHIDDSESKEQDRFDSCTDPPSLARLEQSELM